MLDSTAFAGSPLACLCEPGGRTSARTSATQRASARVREQHLSSFEPRTPMLPPSSSPDFGSRNERLLKQFARVSREINALEPAFGR